jgi:hypothetical protein
MERGLEGPPSPEILPKAAKVAFPTPMERRDDVHKVEVKQAPSIPIAIDKRVS